MEREARIFFLLNSMLAEAYVKADDLAEKMFISRSQLTKDLRVIRELMKRYDLTLVSIPYHGLTVKGSELQKRLCMSDY